MDVPLLIKQRLRELGLDQKDLAAAAEVTESYISQLLARKKAPPAPDRSEIYQKIGAFLRLPPGELSKLAALQRREESKKKVIAPPVPLFRDCRELILRKCDPGVREEVRQLFQKEPFGELERLVTQKLLDVTRRIANEELANEDWLRRVGEMGNQPLEQIRAAVLEFLDADVFGISVGNCLLFLDPLLESWTINLKTFGMQIVLNPRLAAGVCRRVEFVESQPEAPPRIEPGFEEFLGDPRLSGNATSLELDFLRTLTFTDRQPTALYYYRELQSLRDPLHFRPLAE